MNDEQEREFFGHILPRYNRRVFKAPSRPMPVEVFKEVVKKRAVTESTFVERLNEKKRALAQLELHEEERKHFLESEIEKAKEAEREKERERERERQREERERQDTQRELEREKERLRLEKEKEKERVRVEKEKELRMEKIRERERKLKEKEKLQALGSAQSLKKEAAAETPRNGAGASVSGVEGVTTVDGEDQKDEDKKRMEEMQAKLDKLADQKHDLMLNLKQILSSERDINPKVGGERNLEASAQPPPPLTETTI
mmetsp:Transcript_19457/g.32713  ORF Transcript_19457/g.32713 Transcript_19457/m.32713 type:complete len:258 (-) Transcript_19457:316-1089(-)|eukprot:CAMPEP_0198211176 /NCGR_PEP_ID=MMETSP1445-20131203/22670_1 /TAXON_ID=36898 /ORGANISM="Pyramimonas sp., Strain CCMP2087" /LENGTH=257 /DNA_ID=CAMNT_0043885387 /DNA_START=106 /DNA_END=879 /DNA_ORIENTATION=+